jgi:tetratricopeptide (TPR) repeat protein
MNSNAAQDEVAQAMAMHRRGEFVEAGRRYQALLERFPNSADLLNLKGAVSLALTDYPEAFECLARAVGLKPTSSVIACNFGLTLKAMGRLDEARAAFDRALKLDPKRLEAWFALASIERELGDLNAALGALDRVIALDARHAAAHCNRGNVLQSLRQFDAARDAYANALAIDDATSEAYLGLANCLLEEGRAEEAAPHFECLISRWPEEPAHWLGWGNVCLATDKLEEAESHLRQALMLAPSQAETLASLGVTLKRMGRLDEAERMYLHALQLYPDSAPLQFNLGLLYQEQRQWTRALSAFEEVIALHPNHADAHFNRGVLLRRMKRYSEAAEAYGKSIQLRPQHAESHYNRAINWLTLGDFERGWAEYEWRWQLEHIRSSRRLFSQPLWQGQESLEGKTILLHAEQGLGDTIQFSRFAACLKARGARVVMEVQPALNRLLKTLKGVDVLLNRGDELPDFDYHCPLMSLPLALRLKVSDINGESYLNAEPSLIREWLVRLGPRQGERIGLVWSGNADYEGDAERSISFESLMRYLPQEGDFVCLQQRLRAEDSAESLAPRGIRFFGDDLRDFADTAALVTCMDRVISVDTSVLHLAGALGVCADAILPEVPDFRWMGGGGIRLWYGSCKELDLTAAV